MTKLTQTLDQNPKQQLGLIAIGEILGYLCGVPMPILTAFPFIVAPKLLQPLINYSYLTMPLGIMAYQINKDPAQYLRGNLLNFAAIGGLILVKKVLSVKMAASQAVIENNLSISIEEDYSDDSQEQPVLQAHPEHEVEPILFQHASRTMSNARRDRVPYLPLSYVFDNVSDDDSAEDSDYEPETYRSHF